MAKTMRDILTEWLRAHGYDGLCNPDIECGCALDDLQPCDSYMLSCKPAYKGPCTCGWGCEFDMYVEKPEHLEQEVCDEPS